MKHLIFLLFFAKSFCSVAQWTQYDLPSGWDSTDYYSMEALRYTSPNTVWGRYTSSAAPTYKSTDGGRTFSVVNTYGLYCFQPINDTLSYAMDYKLRYLLRSADGALNFDTIYVIGINGDTGFTKTKIARLFFYNDSAGWAVGNDTLSGCIEVWTTKNGGKSWKKTACENIQLMNNKPLALLHSYFETHTKTSPDGNVYLYESGRQSPKTNSFIKISHYGELWQELTLPENGQTLNTVFFDSLTWIVMIKIPNGNIQDSAIVLTRNGGNTYEYLKGSPRGGALTYVKPTATKNGFLITSTPIRQNNPAGTYISYDTAKTWQLLDTLAHSRIVFYDAEHGISFLSNQPVPVRKGCIRVFEGMNIGIKETTAVAFSLFPNPAKETITIEGNLNISHAEAIDIRGRSISLQFERQNNNYQINVAELPQGIYALKITTEKGVAFKKFVKE